MTPLDMSSSTLEFNCPRCTIPVAETYYGPCRACRAELRSNLRREGRVIELAEYVPKMNVTPNAVALKDD
jgi:hypothetical protein